jgi:hypothetical protein
MQSGVSLWARRNAKGHTLRAGTVGGVRLFVGFPDDRGLIFI